MRAHNYKSTHRNICRGSRLPNQLRSQKRYHKHYLLDGYNRIVNWKIAIIGQA